MKPFPVFCTQKVCRIEKIDKILKISTETLTKKSKTVSQLLRGGFTMLKKSGHLLVSMLFAFIRHLVRIPFTVSRYSKIVT
jgi:hypothetical protein